MFFGDRLDKKFRTPGPYRIKCGLCRVGLAYHYNRQLGTVGFYAAQQLYAAVLAGAKCGEFVAGGNGQYVESLIQMQSKRELENGGDKRIGLIVPAYVGEGGEFTIGDSHYCTANIRDLSGEMQEVTVNFYMEIDGNVDRFYIEPDANHPHYFTMAVDEGGHSLGIKSVPETRKVDMKAVIAAIKVIDESSDALKESGKTEDNEAAIAQLKKKRSELVRRRLEILAGKDTHDVSLVTRYTHFDELAAALVKHLYVNEHMGIEAVHSHNFGGVATHLGADKVPIATVNTLHGESGQGLFVPDSSQKGLGATPRGEGYEKNYVTYPVSEATLGDVLKQDYATGDYTRQLEKRGRLYAINNIADMQKHGMHNLWKDVDKFKMTYPDEWVALDVELDKNISEEDFQALPVHTQKAVAKAVFAAMLPKEYPGRALSFDPDKKTILWLSRIRQDKGSELIEGIIQTAKEAACNVVIAGLVDPNDPKFSAELVARLQVDYPDVPFILGRQEQGNMGCLFRAAADVGVGTSHAEAFGLVYAEGGANGMHYVVTDVGGSSLAIPNYEKEPGEEFDDGIQVECGSTFPLYRGGDADYHTLQTDISQLQRRISELHHMAIVEGDPEEEIKAEIRGLHAELQERKQALDEMRMALGPRLKTVDEKQSKAAMQHAMVGAIKRVTADDAISDTIVSAVNKACNPEAWLDRVYDAYAAAGSMATAHAKLSSDEFRDEVRAASGPSSRAARTQTRVQREQRGRYASQLGRLFTWSLPGERDCDADDVHGRSDDEDGPKPPDDRCCGADDVHGRSDDEDGPEPPDDRGCGADDVRGRSDDEDGTKPPDGRTFKH